MSTAHSTLRKILNAEAAGGHANKAVIGGLDKLAPLWEKQARAAGFGDDFIDAVLAKLQRYSALPPPKRTHAVKELLSMVAAHAAPETTYRPEQTTPPPRTEPHQEPAPLTASDPDATFPLDAPLTVVSGIGPSHAETLKKIGLHCVQDALHHFPHRYVDYSALKPINRLRYRDEVTIIGSVQNTRLRRARSGKAQIVEIDFSDGTGKIPCSWFNQPWLEKQLRPGRQIQVSGRIDLFLGRKVLSNPDWEPLDVKALHTGRIVPVYSLTTGVTAKTMRRWMHTMVSAAAGQIEDPLPAEMRTRLKLPAVDVALRGVHFPDSQQHLRDSRRRMAFSELMTMQLGMRRQKNRWQARGGQALACDDNWLAAATATLPFELTAAQQRALTAVMKDLADPTPMCRLLQGDVGSGKTVVAALALAIAARNGAQGALMAPTSILAEQHFQSVRALLSNISDLDLGGDRLPAVRLLLGATPQAERDELAAGLQNGTVKILIGTHALIQQSVQFSNLALAVVDEQHRFGVKQRAALREKGSEPHLLVMTATPIPRSLALTAYGDLDLSVIDELPPGRRPVETRVIYPLERQRAYNFVRAHAKKGRQAFLVFPLVEESEKLQEKAAVAEHERLKKDVFPDLRLGLLHGKMKAVEKDAVMSNFRNGETDVLVATTVIEVGVDVPNASIMMVEGADRFGLAQLHQLRGRVGRGGQKSYCLLVSEGKNGRAPRSDDLAGERLKAMESTTDGFVLAEKDLQLRGPGEFLGTRQAGFHLQWASLSDMALIDLTINEAEMVLEQDPQLEQPEHRLLAEQAARSMHSGTGKIS
ncbi:MAG TPA: ATP-dependent DNA helicase RecG [Anaerolineales bacterium]|jgi:ATP-dependent DNA helicase RecG|nr:ATP-dependent DNA helicase RecG [Anaerolineales bacterium]